MFSIGRQGLPTRLPKFAVITDYNYINTIYKVTHKILKQFTKLYNSWHCHTYTMVIHDHQIWIYLYAVNNWHSDLLSSLNMLCRFIYTMNWSVFINILQLPTKFHLQITLVGHLISEADSGFSFRKNVWGGGEVFSNCTAWSTLRLFFWGCGSLHFAN